MKLAQIVVPSADGPFRLSPSPADKRFPRQLSAGHRDTGMSDSLGQGPSGGCGLCKKHRDAVDKWPRSGQANFLELSANRVLRGSRQSDSNRRPADYKSAALDQLSYAGAFLGKLRLREAHTTLFRTERNLIISVRPTRVFGNADHSVADRTLDRAGAAPK